jgi:3-methyladenine DNA glycosylase AlkD
LLDPHEMCCHLCPVDKDEVLAWLKQKGSRRGVEGMARYGITSAHVFGVSVATLRTLRKRTGMDQELSLALWDTGWYEARLLAAFVGDPKRVTKGQMNAWAKGFENWADCDTVCFHPFDRTPFAWEKAERWAVSSREFVKRAGFALMASLALHDKKAPDERFLPFFPPIEKGASDGRNFVKKAVSWALRGIGKRNAALNKTALTLAAILAGSNDPSTRWVGKDAQRDLARRTFKSRKA